MMAMVAAAAIKLRLLRPRPTRRAADFAPLGAASLSAHWLGVSFSALGFVPAARVAAVEPGTMIDSSTADEVKDLLPPEIYKHFKNGEYMNKLVDFPNAKWAWDDGFDEATKRLTAHRGFRLARPAGYAQNSRQAE